MSQRKLNIGTNEHTTIFATDERGMGNANHEYSVVFTEIQEPICDKPLCEVSFQNGPIKENGKNGIHNEDLMEIVIDRLCGFQDGEYACEENGKALALMLEALATLRERTDKRKLRGVEGTNIK